MTLSAAAFSSVPVFIPYPVPLLLPPPTATTSPDSVDELGVTSPARDVRYVRPAPVGADAGRDPRLRLAVLELATD